MFSKIETNRLQTNDDYKNTVDPLAVRTQVDETSGPSSDADAIKADFGLYQSQNARVEHSVLREHPQYLLVADKPKPAPTPAPKPAPTPAPAPKPTPAPAPAKETKPSEDVDGQLGELSKRVQHVVNKDYYEIAKDVGKGIIELSRREAEVARIQSEIFDSPCQWPCRSNDEADIEEQEPEPETETEESDFRR